MSGRWGGRESANSAGNLAQDAGDRKSQILKEIEGLRKTREGAETAKERDAAHVKITNLSNELKSLK